QRQREEDKRMGDGGTVTPLAIFASLSPHLSLWPCGSVAKPTDLGRFAQGLFALLPVAGAKLIGLQRVEHAQSLIHAPPDRQIITRHPSDDAFGIDDECRAQRHALFLVKDSQRR